MTVRFQITKETNRYLRKLFESAVYPGFAMVFFSWLTNEFVNSSRTNCTEMLYVSRSS